MKKEEAKIAIKKLAEEHNISVDELLSAENVGKEAPQIEAERKPRQRRPSKQQREPQRKSGVTGGGPLTSSSMFGEKNPITSKPVFGREGEKEISDRIWNRRR